MKKTIYLFTILFFIIISSVKKKKKYEKWIIGTWKLSDIQVVNLNTYVQVILDMQIKMLDGQIKQVEDQVIVLKSELKTLKDKKLIADKNAQIESLNITLKDFETQKSELTFESLNSEFQAQFDEMKQKFSLVFNKNKTFENLTDGSKGSYSFSSDKKKLITVTDENNKDEIFITSLDKNKLVLFLDQTEGDLNLQMTMIFLKQ